jgi:hypothetical protein
MFSYDLTTQTGNLRLFIADTNPLSPIWQDEELQIFLNASNGILFLAASFVLETESTDNARIAIRRDIGDWGTTRGDIYKALQDRASSMRNLAPVLPVVVAPLPISTLDDNQGNAGTMDSWYSGDVI